jgi:hypothetical protein
MSIKIKSSSLKIKIPALAIQFPKLISWEKLILPGLLFEEKPKKASIPKKAAIQPKELVVSKNTIRPLAKSKSTSLNLGIGKMSTDWVYAWYGFPVLMLLFQMISVLFAEKLPENEGLGWDGGAYAHIVQYGLDSIRFNDFYIFRTFPIILVNVALKIFGLLPVSKNIVFFFGVLNAISIALGVYFIQRIFKLLQINASHALFGMFLIFFNFGLLRFVVYYPVMTDAMSFVLVAAMLFAYFKNKSIELFFVSLAGTFTTPLLIPIGFALLLFPYSKIPYQPLEKKFKNIIPIAFIIYYVAISYYVVYVVKYWLPIPLVLQPNYELMDLGIVLSALVFGGIGMSLCNKTFFTIHWIKSLLNWKAIAFAMGFITLIYIAKSNIPSKGESPYPMSFFINTHHTTVAFMRPLIGIGSQVNFFGAIILLCIVFWREISIKIHDLGLGFIAACVGILLLFGQTCEARTIYGLLPFLGIVFIYSIKDLDIPKYLWIGVIVLNFIIAKLWLVINYTWGNGWDANGAANFPNQWFWMHLGPWMSWEVWATLLGLSILFSSIFFAIKKRFMLTNSNATI